MPKPDELRPATGSTADLHIQELAREGLNPRNRWKSLAITNELRKELTEKGLKGFKRGGKVKKTGTYKLHKGEKVLTAAQAKKPAARKLAAPRKAGRRR